MDLSRYYTLTEAQLKLLSFCAFVNTTASRYELADQFDGLSGQRYKQTTTHQDFLFLQTNGYLGNNDTFGWMPMLNVALEHRVRVLYLLYRHHPDWVKKFGRLRRRSLGGDPSREDQYIALMVKSLVEKKQSFVWPSDVPFSEHVQGILAPVFLEPELQDVWHNLSVDNLGELILMFIEYQFDHDIVDTSDDLLALMNSRPDFLRQYGFHYYYYLVLRYLACGTMPDTVDQWQDCVWKSLMQGICALYNGEYKGAAYLMSKATKQLEKSFKDKNSVFHNPLLNLLVMVALLLDGSDTALIDKLFAILNEGNYSNYLAAKIYCLVVRSPQADLPVDLVSHLFMFAQQYKMPMYAHLGYLIVRHLGIDTDALNGKVESIYLSATYNQCHWAFMRHEMSPYIALPAEEKTELEQKFGSRCILTALPVPKHWERVLAKLAKQLEQDEVGAQDETQRSTRLVYNIDGSNVNVREQTRRKNGEWSSGKLISSNVYWPGDLDSMDDLDRQIWKEWRVRQRLSVAQLLPLLVGHDDRLLAGSRAPFSPCTVREEKPYLATEKTDNGLVLHSNVPLASLKSQQGPIYYTCGVECDYSYFKLDGMQANLLKSLLSVGNLPNEAESQVRELFSRLGSKMEIHSNLVEGGSTLEQREGNGVLVLQVNPHGAFYDVSIRVRPLEGGRILCLPGRGEDCIFDESEGTRYQVIRHKDTELSNYEPLVDMLDELGVDLEELSCFAELTPVDMLEVVDFVQQRQEQCSIEWLEGKGIKVKTTDTSRWNVSLKQDSGWFDVEGEVPIDDDTVLNISELLELMGDSHGRFIKLNDDEYVRISDGLRRQLQRIESLAQKQGKKLRIPQVSAGIIGDALNGELNIGHPKSLDALRKKIKESQRLAFDVPADLNATLRDYQQEGYQWLCRLAHWGAGACLADDMGLGKTVQTIAFMLNKKAEGPSLVLAPASVAPNWVKEIDKFAPTMRSVLLNDLSITDRVSALQEAKAGDIIVSSYGLLNSQEGMLDKKWNVMCLDEAHSIKNRDTKTSAQAMQLDGAYRIILTGTPIQNHLGELWNLFQFINPGLLGSYDLFTRKYINPIEVANDKDRQKQLKRIVQPFLLRRTKQEVIAELPDKQEITIPVTLSTEEMGIYEVIRRQAKQEIEENSGPSGKLSVNALSMITKLRMAACSAALANKNLGGPSSKIDSFIDLASEICDGGNRVLVFSQFTSFLDMVRKALAEKLPALKYFYLDGSTPIKERSRLVDEFQQGSVQLFLISLKAGGLGLNLTGANYVIHLDPWWNPAIEQQATDRAYRIGQEQKVTVYHLISQHTIEEKIVRLHQTKRDLADSLLEGSDMSHKLTAQDLLNMIGSEPSRPK